MQPVKRSNGLEKLDGGVVAAHEEMLAVVDDGAGGGIAKRAGAPAKVGLLFQQANPLAGLGQRHARRQAGKTATDDENVERHFRLSDFRFWIGARSWCAFQI